MVLDSSSAPAPSKMSHVVLEVREPGPRGNMVSGFSGFPRKRTKRKFPNSARRFSLMGRFYQRQKTKGRRSFSRVIHPGRDHRSSKFGFSRCASKTEVTEMCGIRR
ncbi:hypothetical protein EVAR_53726_1 [Eumeta japonica]|uniref:Uncharacterized protein n=1 Tax=Eumeta variegata TaxID=151549 RepID=A0A4C1Z282_EUMVA|nr:hypothetical protein EVAR_53726_1 [Eumeta japonica]